MENRWYLEVWKTPPGRGRYRDAHPDHAAKGMYCGTVEPVGQLVFKTYKTAAGAKRAAKRYRKMPGVFVDVNPGFFVSL